MPAYQDQRLVPEVASPQHYAPATARELRAQSVHRLQIGLFGLAAMLLIVGLANIIMDSARLGNATVSAGHDASTSATAASDPLADIGVVPSPGPTASQAKRPLGH
jgi:hypothetical protein